MTIMSSSQHPEHLRYSPQLDGIRGVGAFFIMLVHAKGPYFVGGYIWIDMFFVLSSFLITALLLHEQNQHGNIDLKHFYIKRVLRIAPPLITILIFYGLAATLLQSGEERQTLLTDGMYALSNLSNWVKAFYVSDMYYLGHTWSLSL